MLDRETLTQTEALTLRLIRLADARHDAGDYEGAAIAGNMVEALCDLIDHGWVADVRAQA